MNLTISLMCFLLSGYFIQFFVPSHVDPTRNFATLIDNIFISHSPNLKFTSGLVFTDLSGIIGPFYYLNQTNIAEF